MKSKYLQKYKKEINKISVRTSTNVEDVEEVLEHFFDCLKNWIKDRRMPKIAIPYFGTFHPEVWKIKRYIRKYLYHYRKGNSPKIKVQRAISRVWPVMKRLQIESSRDKAKPKQHKKWSKLDPKTLYFNTEENLKENE